MQARKKIDAALPQCVTMKTQTGDQKKKKETNCVLLRQKVTGRLNNKKYTTMSYRSLYYVVQQLT
jgi:hypothetical protein